MLRTFNCGIGMVAVADGGRASEVVAALQDAGAVAVIIGEIEPGRGVASSAKGRGGAEAVRYSGVLEFQR
jgi:phosphoribosylaminoimidazole (AIR) synthetase